MNARQDLDHASRAADSVLAVDMSDVRLESRVPQFIVGWCRGAFAQIRAITALVDAGFVSAAGPNQRLLYETVVRLLWLSSLEVAKRRTAVDERLEYERRDARRTVEMARSLGYATDFPMDEMMTFALESTGKGALFTQAKNFLSAATQADATMFHALWRQASGLAHASGTLAKSYAPAREDSWLGSDLPDPQILRGEALASTMLLLVTLTSRLLTDEGVPGMAADRFVHAYLAAD